MDPLFGFIDGLSLQHHQPEEESTSTGVGEYTISYPSQSDHYQLQQSNNAQLSNTPQSSAQLVHVVSENAQNEKQIYVIKLENFLKDDGNPVKTITVEEREGAFVVDTESSRQSDFVEDDSSSESSSGGEDESVESEQDSGAGPDPFLVVAPEAVMAMAQSVGVELNEDDASELGCLTINKLRSVVLWYDHSYERINDLCDLQVHHDSIAESIDKNKFEKLEEELLEESTKMLDAEIGLATNDENDSTTEVKLSATESENDVNHTLLTELEPDEVGEEVEEEVGEKIEIDEGEDVVDVVNKLFNENEDAENTDEKDEQKHKDCNGEVTNNVNLAPEWISYLQMLIEQVVTADHIETTSFDISSDFKRILKDIRQNGLNPIFRILCDMFRDYLKEKTLTRGNIMNMLSVVDSLISSKSEPTLTQMTDLGCFLIEVIILPPPCDVHQYLTHVFMKIMKNCNELLTWTCTYVTELLKGISETPFDQIKEPFKATMHGALCLVNGLETLKIQVAQEFGWHSSVMKFSKNHAEVFDGQAYNPTIQDSFLEEEILKFYYNFIKNYISLVPPLELSRIQECVTTLYGERFLSFAPPAAATAIVSLTKNVSTTVPKNKSIKKTRCVFRKIIYKDKEIIVPCRKIVK